MSDKERKTQWDSMMRDWSVFVIVLILFLLLLVIFLQLLQLSQTVKLHSICIPDGGAG